MVSNVASRKRRDLSITDKVKILKNYDALFPTSQRDAALKLGISQPLLNRILKYRVNLEKTYLNNGNLSRKRKRVGKDKEVEIALVEWFENARDKDVRVNGPLLREKAEDLARKLGKEDFVATEGWFRRFTNRNNLVYRRPCGEQRDADTPAVKSWLKDIWPTLLEKYTPDDIYNADETGLYYRALPETTYVFKNESTKGCKIAKDRVTILLCVSMAGKKEKPLVIGKSANPRCFKNVKKLPLQYCSNKNAWMTAVIFKKWLIDWDLSLDRNILLLIDNCTAHSIDASLKHIRIVYLPANTTSLLQPLNQGIIRTFKAYYRKNMRKLLEEIEYDMEGKSASELCRKTDLLSAVHLLSGAWDSVTPLTVQNCFKAGSFVPESEHIEVLCDPIPMCDTMLDTEFIKWVSFDDDLATSPRLSEEEICEKVPSADNDDLLSSDDEYEIEINPPTHKELTNSLSILRRAVQCQGSDEHFNQHNAYENTIRTLMRDGLKQSSNSLLS